MNWSFIGLIITYTLSIILPIFVVKQSMGDYAMVTFIRISSVLFPVVLQYGYINAKQIIACVLMAMGFVFLWIATDSILWPQLSTGFLLALLASFMGSLTGLIQRKMSSTYDPFSKRVLFMHGVPLIISIIVFGPSLRIPNAFEVFIGSFIILSAGYQTTQINKLFQTKKGQGGIYLTLMLSFRKILSIILTTNWETLDAVLFYIAALCCATLSILIFQSDKKKPDKKL